MSLPIKTLPILERWDCSACGNCCRGSVIPLSDDDLKRLERQNWRAHPNFAGVKPVVPQTWFGKRQQLAQREDGSCVFLTADNHCQIHAEHGADAKPLVCQMYPLQLVPQENKAILTLRRSCPSAAAEEGRELKDHLDAVKRLAKQGQLLDKTVRAPRITGRYGGTWKETLSVTNVLERLLTDQRYPLVRRLAHGVKFCTLLDENHLDRLDEARTKEVLTIFEEASIEAVAHVFRDRQPPSATTGPMFRQTAAEYVRLHSQYRAQNMWQARWLLARAAVGFARGRGHVPPLHPSLPAVTFAELEEPLGALSAEVQQPLVRFFEANACSLQYVTAARRRWAVTEAFRAMALAYPVALWLLRWCAAGREPTTADVVEAVTIIDRGQGYESLVGGQHRRRVSMICRDEGLERLIGWYAR
ncbi:MAG: hypothetical protein CMJ64_24585 [Planctomycetaceae bacterium]|nr:hypothetical protein [Planctomycetaceae bacterium]